MAAANPRAEGEGESKAARLHSFLSSVFASFFRQREEEGIAEERDFMASKRQELVLQQQKGKWVYKDVGLGLNTPFSSVGHVSFLGGLCGSCYCIVKIPSFGSFTLVVGENCRGFHFVADAL